MRRRFAFFGLTICFLGCNAILGIEAGEFDPPADDAGPDALADSSLPDTSRVETGAPDVVTTDASDAGAFDADADSEVPDANDANADADAGCGDLDNDPKNCGTCGHDCAAGQCQLGVCRPFTVVANMAGDDFDAITVSPTHVIYTDTTTGEVMRARNDGSEAPEQIFAGTPGQGHGIDIGWRDGFVYFFDYGADVSATNLVRCPDTGCTGAPELVLGPLDNPSSLAMTVDGLVTAETKTDGRVMRCHLLPCEASPELVATTENQPNRIAVKDTAVAWTTVPNPQTVRLRVGTDAIATPATAFGTFALAVTDTEVVWAVASTAIRAAPHGGGAPRDVATTSFVERMVVSGHMLFYTDTSSVKAVDLSAPGTLPRTLAGQLNAPKSLAVDDKVVYWVELFGGKIFGVAR